MKSGRGLPFFHVPRDSCFVFWKFLLTEKEDKKSIFESLGVVYDNLIRERGVSFPVGFVF